MPESSTDRPPAGGLSASDEARLLKMLTVQADTREIVNGDVVAAATTGLTAVCPIVTGLLAFDRRLTTEVEVHLRRRERPGSLAEWGRHFATRLETDPDPWISWAAQVDAGTIAVEETRRRVSPSCPGDPRRAMLLIAAGSDPRAR